MTWHTADLVFAVLAIGMWIGFGMIKVFSEVKSVLYLLMNVVGGLQCVKIQKTATDPQKPGRSNAAVK